MFEDAQKAAFANGTLQMQAYHGDVSGALQGHDQRPLLRMRDTAMGHIRQINECTEGVREMADQLFGPQPPQPSAPAVGMPPGISPPSMIEDAQRALHLVDEALEGLRRQLARLGRL